MSENTENTEQKPAYHIPGPYEIALAFAAALMTSGRYDTPDAAVEAAWWSVPAFLAGADTYKREIFPQFLAMAAAASASPVEGGGRFDEFARDPRADVPGEEH